MLGYTGNFINEIKQNGRLVKAELIFPNNLILQDNDIINISYTSQGEKSLGCIVRSVLNASLLYKDSMSGIVNGSLFYLKFYTVSGSCLVGMFCVSRRKKDDKRNVLNIESVDLLEYLRNNTNKPLPLMRDITTQSYAKIVADSLGLNIVIDTGVFDGLLKFAYPTGSHFISTLSDLSIAMQSVLKVDMLSQPVNGLSFDISNACIFVKSYKTKALNDDIIKYDDLLLNFSIDDDIANTYENAVVSLFFPSTSDLKKVCDVTLTIPANYPNFETGKISYSKGVIPQIFSFNGDVDITGYALYDDGCRLTFNNKDLLTKNYNMTLEGFSMVDGSVSENANNSNVKIINNKYIQSPTAYDLRIYKNKSCTISYRGNPCYEVGDTLLIDNNKVIITEHTLEYTGSLKGTMKGVVISG